MAKEKKEETTETRETEGEEVDTSEQFKAFSEEISTKVDNISKVLDKFGTEIGEDRKQRETLSGEIGSIKELIENNNQTQEESEWDPYNKTEREKEILGLIDQNKPDNGEEKYITKDDMNNMLSLANKNSIVTKEFKLTEEEMAEVISESTESGLSVREVAFDKFAKRKFETQDYLEKLSKELQKNDTMEPLESSSETVFDKTGIPSDTKEFKKWYDEKEKANPGSARQAMLETNKVET